MKIPLSWLRDYVDITLPIPQLVERLTLAGLEVGGIRLVGLPHPEGLRAKQTASTVATRAAHRSAAARDRTPAEHAQFGIP